MYAVVIHFLFILLFIFPQSAISQQVELSLSRRIQVITEASGSKTKLETIRLIGMDLRSAYIYTHNPAQVVLEIPSNTQIVVKQNVSEQNTYAIGRFIEKKLKSGKRLVFKPAVGSYEKCLVDRFQFGLLIVCRLSNSGLSSDIDKNIFDSTSVKQILDVSLTPDSSKPILNLISFSGSGQSSKVILQLDKLVQFDLAGVAENHYRIAVHSADLANQGLSLPYFAPQYARGVKLLKITEVPEGLVIDLHMDHGLVPRVTQNTTGLIISL